MKFVSECNYISNRIHYYKPCVLTINKYMYSEMCIYQFLTPAFDILPCKRFMQIHYCLNDIRVIMWFYFWHMHTSILFYIWNLWGLCTGRACLLSVISRQYHKYSPRKICIHIFEQMIDWPKHIFNIDRKYTLC